MNIPVIGCCIDKILGKVGDFLIDGAWREAGYLFNFNKNVADLEDNLNNLKAALIEIQKAEEIDRNNARDIDPVISKWLDLADKMNKDLEAFLEDKIQNKAHGFCFKVPFPNCYNRFKLSRKASKMSADVAELIKEGEPFKKGADEVAHLATLQDSKSSPMAKECENFNSRSKVFDDILAALRDGNVTRVGIYGMPGVGKTTMMEQVRRAMVEKREFEEVAVAIVSATFEIKSIQRKLANDLGLSDLAKEDDESVRAGLLRHRLKNGRKMLVILDDVWCKLPLEDVGIDFGDSRGCKILMTSRERRVCEANKCLPFLIDVLSKEEAWGLFRQHAGNCVEDADINPVAMDVLNECGGLPLIIRAVGEALKDGEQCEWKDAQRQFKNFTPRKIVNLDDQVYKTFELSFNKLKPEEAKSCLLLCSLFREDAEISIDDLSLLAMAMGFLGESTSNQALIPMLKRLQQLGCGYRDSVKLHDVIRDVAIYIASEDVKYRFMVKSAVSAWPEMHKAHRATISLRIENILELPRKLECPQLQTLMLDCSWRSTKIPGTFLDGLENLTVLILVNVSISSVPILPNLLMLRIIETGSRRVAYAFDISTLKKLKELEMLILRCSIRKLPLDLGELKNLRFLDLRWWSQLNFIEEGVLSSLTRLEELYLPIFFDGWNAALLDELNSLTRLTALEMRVTAIETRAIDFDNLPNYQLCKKLEQVAFPALETIELHDLPKIEAIWDNQCPIEESFSQLKELHVDDCGRLKTIVPFVMLPRLTNLQDIRVFGCASIESDFAWPTGVELFPTEITTLLPELKEMTLTKLPELKQTVLSSKELNDEIVVSPKLTNLWIDNCCKLKNVFSLSAARNLKHLEELEVKNCEGMEEIVAPIGKGREESDGEIFFPQLKKIMLDDMKNLTKFWGCGYEEHHEEEIREVGPVIINQPLPFHSNKVQYKFPAQC
ncbi:hypothetical protein RJ639_020341 [Escallonia herrerae]|uniref:AAA+ ATPase domain-containing protein n=1 Tax=Escallonia herrerae TaxID=1293975 RepID=A0AA89AFD7_9ASTE|nr:hypothetical protein RJ639_020341 [Escallonia herrerae]